MTVLRLCLLLLLVNSIPHIIALQDSMFDFLRPAVYKLEQQVAAKSIPSVLGVPGRHRLADHAVTKSDSVDHSLWTACLEAHVTVSQRVGSIEHCHTMDYTGLGQDERFHQYIQVLHDASVATLSPYEQVALWMNAYNALCCKLIVDYELEKSQQQSRLASINDLTKLRGTTVWDQPAGTVGGQVVSLNDIEHKQLRLVWNEPSIHACIVCASASCPNLRPEALVASRLPEQMADQVNDWLSNPTKGLVYKASSNTLVLSRIFLWFQDDFADAGGVIPWLMDNLRDDAIVERLRQSPLPKIRYSDYSWEMNRSTPAVGPA